MNEAGWLACANAEVMLEVFGGVFGPMRLDRRLRRFAVECCRRVRHLITEEVFLQVADAGEAFADDPRNDKDTIKAMARMSAEGWRRLRRYEGSADPRSYHAAKAAVATCAPTDWQAAFNAMRAAARAANTVDAESSDAGELRHQATILRCVFGNPCRPVAFDPGWRTWHSDLPVTMARRMYESRDFADMPVLADALEEAGCTNQEMLSHCRQEGVDHVRGCWVLDAILGKG